MVFQAVNDFYQNSSAKQIVSSAINLGFSQLANSWNSARQVRASQALMNHQDALNRNYYQWSSENGPSFARKGYEQAGFNPLLAVMQSTGSNGNYGATASMADSDQWAQAVTSAIDAERFKLDKKLNNSQVKLNESQSDLNTQSTYKTYADEMYIRKQADVASATEAKIINDIRWNNILNAADLQEILARTKYTNERSRGFSASSSKEKGGSLGANVGNKKFGSVGGNANYHQSESQSRTW